MSDQDDISRRVDEGRLHLVERMLDTVRYGAEVAETLDKTLVSLSGGALVFSMTFVDRLAPAKLWLPVLFTSWVAFAGSMLCVLMSLRALQKAITDKADQLNKQRQEFERALKKGLVGQLSTELTHHAPVSSLNRVAILFIFRWYHLARHFCCS
jgi:hypothetical protein